MSKFKIFIITLFTCLLISVTVAVVYQNIKYDELAKSENEDWEQKIEINKYETEEEEKSIISID